MPQATLRLQSRFLGPLQVTLDGKTMTAFGSDKMRALLAYLVIELGRVAHTDGDYKASSTLHQESLALCRELRDKSGIAQSLSNLGIVAGLQGDYGAARTLLEESLALRRELGYRWGIALSLTNLGHVAVGEGNLGEAEQRYRESLSIAREVGDRVVITCCLARLAWYGQRHYQGKRVGKIRGRGEPGC